MAGDVKRYDISADVRGGTDTDECATGDWVRYEDHAARLTALEQENKRLRDNMRETYEAMIAMRNTINEYVPMPSLESDLLSGPESSVFCSRVAQAVLAALTHEDKT